MIKTPNLDIFLNRLKTRKGRNQMIVASFRILLVAVLWALTYWLYHRNDAPEIVAPEYTCSDLTLITPKQYIPTRCKTVTAATETEVRAIADKLIELAKAHNHNTLTSYSVGLTHCMFVTKEINHTVFDIMLNPRLQSKTQFIRVNERSILCERPTTKAVAQNLSFFSDVYDLSSQRRLFHVSYHAAMNIQHALEVLEGKMVCQ